MAQWKDHIEMRREGGELTKMTAPQIISCSRSTDIPAFYADWFFHRLKVGYSGWTNPFNGVTSYISYANTRFIVFWSKNPQPLLNKLHLLDEREIGSYVQFTLNDYVAEGLEKNVPPVAQRIDTFWRLRERLGLGGVVWRFDPLLLTEQMGVDELLRKVESIGDQLQGATEKLVFSFADIQEYRKVKTNLERSGVAYRLWTESEMEAMAQGLWQLNQKWHYELATCGEKIDIQRYGIAHNRCIDGDLIVRRAHHDKQLMDFLKVKIVTAEGDLFGEPQRPENAIALPNGQYFVSTHVKDKGQRPLCGCMAAKDIGEYNTCPHQCEYCYANANKAVAMNNYRCHQQQPYGEQITTRNT